MKPSCKCEGTYTYRKNEVLPINVLMSITSGILGKQKMEYRLVTAVKAQFKNILQIIGTDVPNNILDLSETFVHALSQPLQKK